MLSPASTAGHARPFIRRKNGIASLPGFMATAQTDPSGFSAAVASMRPSQRLQGNIDYRQSLHRIEVFSGMNAINTAIGNMLMGMTQNISSMIGAEQKLPT